MGISYDCSSQNVIAESECEILMKLYFTSGGALSTEEAWFPVLLFGTTEFDPCHGEQHASMVTL